jgi:hypothetical protein
MLPDRVAIELTDQQLRAVEAHPLYSEGLTGICLELTTQTIRVQFAHTARFRIEPDGSIDTPLGGSIWERLDELRESLSDVQAGLRTPSTAVACIVEGLTGVECYTRYVPSHSPIPSPTSMPAVSPTPLPNGNCVGQCLTAYPVAGASWCECVCADSTMAPCGAIVSTPTPATAQSNTHKTDMPSMPACTPSKHWTMPPSMGKSLVV